MSLCPSVGPLQTISQELTSQHHLIIVLGTLVKNDDISRYFFQFFEILVFWAVKEQKVAQNEK